MTDTSTMLESSQTLPEVLSRLVTATNEHDIDGLVGCFPDDYMLTMPVHPARDFIGNEQVRRNWTQFFAGIPDIHTTITNFAVQGRECWTEWVMSGTRLDGAPHLMKGVAIFTTDGHLIRACRFYVEPVDNGAEGVSENVARLVNASWP